MAADARTGAPTPSAATPSAPTPSVNASLPLCLGDFPSPAQALDYAAQGETGLNFFDGRGRLLEVLPYAELRLRALSVAAALRDLGLGMGGRVALLAETSSAFLAAFYGCQYAGATACLVPNRMQAGSRESAAATLARFLGRTGAIHVFAPENMLALVQQAGDGLCIDTLESLATQRPTEPFVARATCPDAAETAYVQYSSGSTAAPRGIVIETRRLMANVEAIARHGLALKAEDRAFSWLPLYHDMGLVGFSITAMASQRSVDYLPPSAFAMRPAVWLRLMSEQRSTVVYAPSFAWRLAAERAAQASDIDLSTLRIAGVGGDMVRPQDIELFAETFRSAGFRREAFRPSYGLAEAVLAVSMIPSGKEPRFAAPDDLDRRFTGCGRVLPGIDLRITDDVGLPLGEGRVGHIRISGPSVLSRYDGSDAAAARDDDGFYVTGDLGFLRHGELFVTGRAKDLIVLRGRNVWAQDVEWVAETIAPLRPGDTAAFAVDTSGETSDADEEVVVLLVQNLAAARDGLADRIASQLATRLGITARIVPVPPRSLPFTSSGKLARARARELYLAGAFASAARHDMESVE